MLHCNTFYLHICRLFVDMEAVLGLQLLLSPLGQISAADISSRCQQQMTAQYCRNLPAT